MKSHWLKLSVLVVSLSALAVCGRSVDHADVLSVDETMGVIFRGEQDYHLLQRANPDARQALYEFLEDEVFKWHHPQAIRILGWIGESSDVVELREMIDRFEGPLQALNRRRVEAVFQAWATMARRDIPGAEEEIARFCMPEAWNSAPFSWQDPALLEEHPEYAYDGPIHAIRTYSVVGEGNMKELREQLLREVEDPGARHRINYYLTDKYVLPAIQKREEQEARPVTDRDREQLRGVLTRVRAAVAGQETASGREEGPRQTDAEEAQETAAAAGPLSPETTADVREIIEEGLAAYHRFVGEWISEDYDSLLQRLLNNDRPVYPEKLKRDHKEHLKDDLNLERPLIMAAQRKGLFEATRYRNFRVSMTLSASLEQIGTAEEREAPRAEGSETITLLFEIPGSAETWDEFLRQVGRGVGGGSEMTFTLEEDLQVYMKRINGTWYWNPFGW